MKRIRLVVADDHPLYLQGIRAAIDSAEDMEVVATADSGAKLLPLIAREQPDFVLMDFIMPRFDGMTCLDTIHARFPDVKVAVISGTREPEMIEAALRRGACAFILKTIEPDDLASVIRQVMKGTVFQSVTLTQPETAGAAQTAGLTERELTILQGLARGLSNEAIAKENWITRQTVKFHVRNIYRKIGVANRTEAARYAFQHALAPSMVDELNAAAVATIGAAS